MHERGIILSIQLGQARKYGGEDGSGAESWVSAIAKVPVAQPVRVEALGLEGDEQVDLGSHGGVDKAVLAYAASNYEAWKRDLPSTSFPFGAFGENLTIAGMDESSVCVGDVYEVGACRLQVSQPRQPCWKLSRRWGIPELSATVQKNGRTGWYYRVLEPGVLEAGLTLQLIERPFPKYSIASANDVMHKRIRSREQDLELAACAALSESWRKALRTRAAKSPAAGI
jgi:MOSC domain-containing protein YiiM